MILETQTISCARRALAIATTFMLLGFSAFGQSGSPNISTIADQGVFPNSTSRPIACVIGDADTPANLLSLAGSSGDQNLVPNTGIVFSGSGSNQNLTITPAAGQVGATIITLVVTDTNGGAASNSFALDVNYFTPVASGLLALGEGQAVWGDYDNDGRLDVLTTGFGTNGFAALIFHNNGDGTFSDIEAGLTGGSRGIAAWVDYNRDGRLDVLLTADVPRLYRNDDHPNADDTYQQPLPYG